MARRAPSRLLLIPERTLTAPPMTRNRRDGATSKKKLKLIAASKVSASQCLHAPRYVKQGASKAKNTRMLDEVRYGNCGWWTCIISKSSKNSKLLGNLRATINGLCCCCCLSCFHLLYTKEAKNSHLLLSY